jgi:hypothetical protein
MRWMGGITGKYPRSWMVDEVAYDDGETKLW